MSLLCVFRKFARWRAAWVFLVLLAPAAAGAQAVALGDSDEAQVRRMVYTLSTLLEKSAPSLDPAQRVDLAEMITAAAGRHHVDPYLILAVISVESGFSGTAKSSRGALGLMQVKPRTAREWSRRINYPMNALGLFDWRTNIELGTAYLAHLHDRLGSWSLALTAYNQGPARVRRTLRSHGVALVSHMRGYERRVTKRYKRFTRHAETVEFVSLPMPYAPVMLNRDPI